MRDNYFVKLIKYIKNVYHIDKKITHISDNRIKAYESLFYMPELNNLVRFVKFAKKQKNSGYSQTFIAATAVDMNVKTIYKIMKVRWNIENCVFNNLKNNANLNHYFVHGVM